MARPEEKAQSMLNRYLKEQRGETSNSRRPHLASLCEDLPSAGKWRAQVERDIRLRVTEIHNSSLSVSRIRELNDSINRLIRERKHWDRRVVQLGGRSLPQPKNDGITTSNGGGYLYFGAARELPEVRDVLKRIERNETSDEIVESNDELYQRLSSDYYNVDYDDIEEMKTVEIEMKQKLRKDWHDKYGHVEQFEWDDSFKKFIGMKPAMSAATEINEQTSAVVQRDEEMRQKRNMVKEMLGSNVK